MRVRYQLPIRKEKSGMEFTTEQAEAIGYAVKRETESGTPWPEIKDRTLEGLCAENQDALIDDCFEDPDLTSGQLAEIRDLVAVYDGLLGTNRASEIPATVPR